MATAGDGRAPYESGGAGGKFRKRPSRRSAPATPYDRPPTALRNNNRGLFTKLVDPASRLIYAGAHKLFGVFRKRLPPLPLQGPPENNEEPKNISKETGQNNSTGVSKLNTNQDGNSSATGISDLEQMLKQKSFTRSEIEHLTALLHSRTTESSSDNNPAKRIEASTSGSLKIYENSYTAITTPVISSRVLEEKTPSPADLAKAYMGSKPTKLPQSPLGLIQDSNMINNTTTLQKTLPKNGFLTPRSRGRSAMYSMARTPYAKSPLNFNQKEIMSSSESLKRRSSVLDDDFGSGGPLRRTRQKPNLLLNSKRELGYTAFQESMLLRNEPEEKSTITNPSVPTKSTETATKIFQQLEKLSPKKSPTKLTSNMLHGQALRSLEKVELPKFVDTSKDVKNLEGRKFDSEVKSKSKGKEKVEENGERKFPVPFNMLTTVNGDVGVSIKENVEIVKIDKIDDSVLKVPDEQPHKIRAFQMSVPEDSLELDDDDDDVIHVNGHVSFPLVETKKPETSLVPNKPVVVDVIEPVRLPEASKTPVFSEVTPVAESQKQVDLKEGEKDKLSPKSDGFPGGNVIQQETGFKFPSTFTTQTSAPSQSNPQKDQVTPIVKVSPFQFSSNEVSEIKPKESSESKAPKSTSVFSSITKNDQFKAENGNDQKLEHTFGKSKSLSPIAVDPATSTSGIFSFASSAKTSSPPNTTPDSTPSLFPSSTPFPPSDGNTNSLFNNNNNNNNTSSNITPASTTTTPVFSFGSSKQTSVPETVNIDNTNNTINDKEPKPTINTSLFSTTTTPSGGGVFGFSSPATTSTTTTTTGGPLFGFSSPAASSTTATGGALFGFSALATTSTTTTTATGGALFGFSAPATTSTTTSGGALFGFSSPATTSTTTAAAATTTSSTLFGFSAPAATSTTTTTTTTGAPFGFSSPAVTSTATATTTTTGGALFGFSAPATTSTTVPFQFGSGPTSTTSLFGSSTPTFGTTATSSEGKSGTSVFGSSWQPPPQNPPVFSFGASPTTTTTPITFGASPNPNPSTGSSTFSFTSGPTNPFGTPTPVFNNNNNNNDQMSMEDSMAEDSMQTPSPTPVSPFGQPPGPTTQFMFGQAPAVQPQAGPTAFQFGGQPSLPVPPQNPFQSSSVEFNGGGGSFSLGSTGGEKSGRRIVKINKSKNRRK